MKHFKDRILKDGVVKNPGNSFKSRQFLKSSDGYYPHQ